MTPLILYAYVYPAILAGFLLSVAFIVDWIGHGLDQWAADLATAAFFTFVPVLNIGASVFILSQWYYIARDWVRTRWR